jgi:hypothetical protein
MLLTCMSPSWGWCTARRRSGSRPERGLTEGGSRSRRRRPRRRGSLPLVPTRPARPTTGWLASWPGCPGRAGVPRDRRRGPGKTALPRFTTGVTVTSVNPAARSRRGSCRPMWPWTMALANVSRMIRVVSGSGWSRKAVRWSNSSAPTRPPDLVTRAISWMTRAGSGTCCNTVADRQASNAWFIAERIRLRRTCRQRLRTRFAELSR